MGDSRSRSGILVGLAAAAGAFGVAATMSTVTAPTAHADAYSDIISAVDGDFTNGQAALTEAVAFFDTNQLVFGLATLFDGVNDDALSAPDNFFIGSVEALTNEAVTGNQEFSWGLAIPSSFSDALTSAQSDITTATAYFTNGATDLASGDYGGAAIYDTLGSDLASIAPLEELLLGVAVSF
jgi:hypothetical protein